jgi:CHAT domain-containing protein/Tfp pilus assembly protein PilF
VLEQEIDRLSQESQYSEAIAKARELVDRLATEADPNHSQLIRAISRLAHLLMLSGDIRNAGPVLERELKLREETVGPNHPDVARTLIDLALTRQATGHPADARPLLERALRIQEAALGPNDPAVAITLGNLALALQALGDHAAARPLLERQLRIQEQALGPSHPDLAPLLITLALTYQTLGDHSGARPLLERALRIQEQTLGLSDPAVATTLFHLAFSMQLTRDYAGARPLLERALKIQEGARGPDDPEVGRILTHLAISLQVVGDLAGARPLLERALRIHEQAREPDSLYTATVLGKLALSLDSMGEYREARPLFERALRVQESFLGPHHLDLAPTLTGLAMALEGARDHTGARLLLKRALAIQEPTLGPNHPDIALTLQAMALVLVASGDDAAAHPLLERELKIEEAAFGVNHPKLALTLNSLGRVLGNLGDYKAAKVALDRAYQIQVQALGEAHPDVALILDNMAFIMELMGNGPLARLTYFRSLLIRTEALGPLAGPVSFSLKGLARSYQNAGDPRARALLERALKIQEDALRPTSLEVADTLIELGSMMLSEGDPAGAKALVEHALKIQEQSGDATRVRTAAALALLGGVLASNGEYVAARSTYDRALRIAEQSVGATHPVIAVLLECMADLLAKTGDYGEARVLSRRALTILEAAVGTEHRDTASALARVAAYDWALGSPQSAKSALVQVLEIIRKYTDRGVVGLSNQQKLLFLYSSSYYVDLLLSLPNDIVLNSEAYQAILDRKNLVFNSLAEERLFSDSGLPPQMATLPAEYRAVRRELARLTVNVPVMGDLQQYRSRIATLNERLEILEAMLSGVHAALREAQLAGRVNIATVCAALPKDGIFIDYFQYTKHGPQSALREMSGDLFAYLAFVLRSGDCATPIRVDLGPAAQIDEDVQRLRAALSRDTNDPTTRALRAQYRQTVAARLYAKLFPPALQKAIEGKRHLLIAPDGALALLPFALLPGEDGHEFLLETRTISYLPSGRDLLRAKDKAPPAPTLLAVGAPAFDRIPVQVAQAATVRAGCGAPDDPFAPLPGTAAELQAIAAAARQARPTQAVTLLEGTQATKAAFLEQAPKAGILHLATHAYFAGAECTPAGLVATPQRTLGESPAFLGHNPLLLAGIALAGANDREKADGILTALEITALDLRNTDLVVLSACDTGLGTLARGQELLGLRWAFAYAGVQHLVTSLWTVPDQETAALMGYFYTALWQRGLSVPDALRAAQLEMLKVARAQGDPAPHVWGAFVASGE